MKQVMLYAAALITGAVLNVSAPSASLSIGTVANADVYCNPERSFPCGNGCARKGTKCTKNWSTSKVGINPDKGQGKRYSADEVKHVETAPSDDQGGKK